MIRDGVHAVLLAAGAGTRFGGGKLTALWRGEPLVRTSARIALASPAERVTAVTGADAPVVEAALAPLAGLVCVRNPDWEDGLAGSLRAGLDALPSDATHILVFLGDMPLVDPGLAARLLNEMGDAPAIVASCQGVPLHPVAFSAALIPRLRSLTGDKGARSALLATKGVRTIEVATPEAARDIDRPEDLF